MAKVELKILMDRLNPFCLRSLESAAGLCVNRTQYEIIPEHLLLKLLEDRSSDIPIAFRHFELDPARFEKLLTEEIESLRTGNPSKPTISGAFQEWLQDAWSAASLELNDTRIRSGALLIALLDRAVTYPRPPYMEYLGAIQRETLRLRFNEITHGSNEGSQTKTDPAGKLVLDEATALGRFCIDFTEKARAGEIDPVFGRDREIRQMVQILGRRRKNNPIVVGEAGVGKTAVVEGLALRIAEGDVPDMLLDYAILGLDMGLLQAGASMKGEFENRLKSVINEVKSAPQPVILFIDEAHVLIGAGGTSGGVDAANLLKPALARGELKTIAATTWSEYKKYFEKDAALARRFQLVKLDQPSEEVAVEILRGLKAHYEKAHGVMVRDDAVETAVRLSGRYISGRYLPDKAIDVLDTSCARVKVYLTAKPDELDDKEREIQTLEREKAALLRDRRHGRQVEAERFVSIEDRLAVLKPEKEVLEARWKREKELADRVISCREKLSVDDTDSEGNEVEPLSAYHAAVAAMEDAQEKEPLIRIEVDPNMVSRVVSDWTGIPLGSMIRDEARGVAELEANLKKRVRGQDEALAAIAEVIKSAKTGIKDPAQPMGVFLLTGPSGVGKTETGLALAEALFGGERFMISVNMSEFQEKHTVSRLIGSPPGYVGYGEGGVLTEAVRQRPYSVVLIDEVEKAHIDVMNIFYQVFDKGVLSDGEGRVIDFKNTVVLMTSNLASDMIAQMCTDGERPEIHSLDAAIRPLLNRHFKPAFIGRTTLVPYYMLSADDMKEIVCLKLDKIVKRLRDNYRATCDYTGEVAERIVARCGEIETGARNIDQIINRTLMPQITAELLSCMEEGTIPGKVGIGVDDDGGEFIVSFEGA